VAGQTIRNIEIILVDDCSTDGSESVAEKWAAADGRVKIISNSENYGVAASRNMGMDAASGDYIAFVDSDDYINVDWAAQTLAAAWNHEVDIVVGRAVALWPSGRMDNYFRGFPGQKIENNVHTGAYNKFCSYVIWGVLFNREFLTRKKLRCLSFKVGEDIEFMYRAFSLCRKVAVELGAVYTYYQRRDGLMGSGGGEDKALAIADCQLGVAETILRNFRESRLYDKDGWMGLAEVQMISGMLTFMLYSQQSDEGDRIYQRWRRSVLSINLRKNKSAKWFEKRIRRLVGLAKTQGEFMKIAKVKITAKKMEYVRRISWFHYIKFSIRRMSEWISGRSEKFDSEKIFAEACGANSVGEEEIFQAYFLKNNMPEKIARLKEGLDDESKQNIDMFLKRSLVFPDSKIAGNYKISQEFIDAMQTGRDKADTELFKKDLPNYKREFALEDDEYSLCVFLHHHGLKAADDKIKKYISGKDFIDGGAFVGDTALMLSKHYNPRSVHSFEISTENMKAYNKNMERNPSWSSKCRFVPMGLGGEVGVASLYDCGGSSSSIFEKGEDKVKITNLDSYAAENNLDVGFIKLDVEGMGLEAVEGMKDTIRKHRPVLSVGIYHNPTEFFEILPRLREICGPDYEFKVVQLFPFSHSNLDTAVFAYPKV